MLGVVMTCTTLERSVAVIASEAWLSSRAKRGDPAVPLPPSPQDMLRNRRAILVAWAAAEGLDRFPLAMLGVAMTTWVRLRRITLQNRNSGTTGPLNLLASSRSLPRKPENVPSTGEG